MVTRVVAAPVAFLVAATVAVGVVRAQLRHHHAAAPPATAKTHVKAKAKAKATPRARYYVVHAGDTLSAIATKTHVPLSSLQKLNPRVQPTALFLGEKIRLR